MAYMRFSLNKPYGGWVDEKGNFTPAIDHRSHCDFAEDYLDSINYKKVRYESDYQAMFKLGFLRIVFYYDENENNNGYSVEVYRPAITKHTQSWVDNAGRVSGCRYEEEIDCWLESDSS
jgi:hypothetical protein